MPWTPLILDEKQMKYPFWTTVVPDDFLPFLGHVMVLWGCYEDMFDEYLEVMIKASGKEPGHGWKTRPYKARKTQFKKQAKLCFKDSEPIQKYIGKMLTDSLPIHRERNLLTHGKVWAKDRDYGEDIFATGFIKKQEVTIPVTQAALTRLFHGLAHLAGRVQFLQDPRPDEEQREIEDGVRMPLERPERLALQDFWFRNRVSPAIAKMHEPPHQAAQG